MRICGYHRQFETNRKTKGLKMASINRATILGNIGKDPEIRALNNGKPVATFSVATSEKWKDKTTGETKELTEWHRVVVFSEPLIDVIKNIVQKGTRVYIEGKLHTRKWTNEKGIDQYTTEIILQGYDSKLIICSGAAKTTPPAVEENPYDNGGATIDEAFETANQIMDGGDEIPF